MIHVNEKEYSWEKGMNLYDVFKAAGYTLSKPSLLVHVNGAIVKKDQWDSFRIEDDSIIVLVNLLRGG